ncbi:hypothetical protein [Endothiovibrio diazotrophicus]
MNEWTESRLAVGEEQTRTIGPLTLRARRLAKEWRIATATDDNMGDPLRFVFADAPARLRPFPRQADRPVIIRPRVAFTLCAGEEVTLFVSTPLWLAVAVGELTDPLLETPVIRPSDTWFGPSTLEGELCYAGRTRAVLERSEVEPSPSHAVTPLRVVNRAATPLPLERVNIPAPALSIFREENGQLWSEAVTLLRDEDGEMASLKIDPGAPPQATRARRLTAPRKAVEGGMLIRAFGGLFK